MTALSVGHFATDFPGGALPVLLPFLVDRFSLNYALAGVIILASAISSSLIQPLFGLWSDRRGAVWLLPAGVAVSGIGIALAADAGSYALVLVLVVLSGLGAAAYHPEGSKFAAYASGHRRASGMSAFSIGGNVGYALGAVCATPIVLWLGLRGALLLAVPPLAAAALLATSMRYLRGFQPDRAAHDEHRGPTDRRALTLLLAVIMFRSVSWFGLLTFVPLYEVSLGHSKAHGNHLLSLMLLAGGVGTVLAGPIADRVGLRRVLMASLLVTPPAIAAFLLLGGVGGAVALAVVGAFVIGTFGITMVMSQQYMPGSIGMASGLAIGFSIGLGGIAAVGLGALGDAVDLRAALWVCAAVPLGGALLCALLPASTARAVRYARLQISD
jgi:FSR family fosmidomycin resistance protein-like MFS transporter